MKKTILFLLTLLTIKFNLIFIVPYQENSVFLNQMIKPRFYDFKTNQGLVIYDTYHQKLYQTNFNGNIYLNTWTNSDLKCYIIDNKIYFWYLKEGQYYYQVDGQEFSCNINNNCIKLFKKPIIDLNLYYQPVKTERGWNGTLYQYDKRLQFISNLTTSDYLICKQYSFVITKLIKAFNAKASIESCEQFDWFINQKTFLSFKHLVNIINHHNLTYSKAHYIDVPLEKMASMVKNRKAFEEIILLLYNTLSYFFGKDQGFKILRAFTIENDCPTEGVTIHNGIYRPIAIKIRSKNLNPDATKFYRNWLTGYSITFHPYAVIAHEFGHLIDLYHLKSFAERINIDNCSGLDNQFSNFTNQTSGCPLINTCVDFCTRQLKQSFLKQTDQNEYDNVNSNNYHDQKKLDYCIIQTVALTQCILSK